MGNGSRHRESAGVARLLGHLTERRRALRSALWVRGLRLRGARIGPGVKVFGRVSVFGPARHIAIGEGSSLNEGVVLEARERIVIGRYCHISSGVKLHTGYLVRDADGQLSHGAKPIVIGDHVWIASSAVVGAGATIGDKVTVGANSLVLGALMEPGLYAGTPARRVK